MPGKPKSPWKTKFDELKLQMPKGFDARHYNGSRGTDGKLDKAKVSKVCEDKGFKDKTEAVIHFLTHLESKPASKKRGAKKQKAVAQEPGKVNLLAKRTYSDLSATEIGKVIAMLTEIENDRKESEIAGLKAKKEEIEKQLKELQGK